MVPLQNVTGRDVGILLRLLAARIAHEAQVCSHDWHRLTVQRVKNKDILSGRYPSNIKSLPLLILLQKRACNMLIF
jgi:hypothetical protein